MTARLRWPCGTEAGTSGAAAPEVLQKVIDMVMVREGMSGCC